VQQLVHADAQQRPVDHGHPLEGPVTGEAPDVSVDLVAVIAHAGHHLGGEAVGLDREPGEDGCRRAPLGLRFVEKREGPFPGLAAGAQQRLPVVVRRV